jgi:RHS repeat-associated protein
LSEPVFFGRYAASPHSTQHHYNYFRDYDPRLGRYFQSDPIGLGGGSNSFLYVKGSPLSLIDRLGLEPGSSEQRGYPPLQRIHPDAALMNNPSYSYWSKQSTEAIISSLKPGTEEPLRVADDGRVFNGNTRTLILEERGFDINSLTRTRYNPTMPNGLFCGAMLFGTFVDAYLNSKCENDPMCKCSKDPFCT